MSLDGENQLPVNITIGLPICLLHRTIRQQYHTSSTHEEQQLSEEKKKQKKEDSFFKKRIRDITYEIREVMTGLISPRMYSRWSWGKDGAQAILQCHQGKTQASRGKSISGDGTNKRKEIRKKEAGNKKKERLAPKVPPNGKKRRESYIIINRKHLSHRVTTRFRY